MKLVQILNQIVWILIILESVYAEVVRSVFPDDVVKFSCIKSTHVRHPHCTWIFHSESNETVTKVTDECFKSSSKSMSTKVEGHEYFGYVKIPSEATSISCVSNDTRDDNPTTLSVQGVSVAKPIRDSLNSHHPIIVMQRFSQDYLLRLAAHDVTDRNVVIDGNDVTAVKLLCIHSKNVIWHNYTQLSRWPQKGLNNRDKEWLSKLPNANLRKNWAVYLNSLRKIEDENFVTTNSSFDNDGQAESDRQIYTVPLTIRHITNLTSRTYVCRSTGDVKTAKRAFVTIRVQNAKNVGPDEIEMIQQIIQLLDDLANDKGNGKQPWATLAPLMSIILILFVYYCKQKLQQSNPSTPAPKPPEETEMTTREETNRNHTQNNTL